MIICFPSPCGVLVLKFYLIFLNHFIDKLGFRPLAGFWFLNLVEKICIPLVVLLFRPLAGFWFLNFPAILSETKPGTGHSVPLRGSGS